MSNNRQYKFSLNSTLKGELPLTENPVGWNGLQNKLVRSKEFEGVFNEFSVGGLTFVDEAYDYLTDLYNQEGIKLDCELIVTVRDNISKQDIEIFRGVLDGSKYKESSQYGRSVQIEIGESSFTQSILARKDTAINYNDTTTLDGEAMTDPTYVDCALYGMEQITTGSGTFEPGTFTGSDQDPYILSYVVENSNNENIKSTPYAQVENYLKIADGGWLYQTFNKSAKITIDLYFRYRIAEDLALKFYTGTKLNPVLDIDGNPIEADPDFLGDLVLAGEFSIPDQFVVDPAFALVNESIEIDVPSNSALIMALDDNAIDLFVTIGENSTMSLEFSEIPSSQNIPAIKPFDLGERLTNSITGLTSAFTSNLVDVDDEYENILDINGYLLRGFTEEDSQYSTTFSDYAKTYRILTDGVITIDNNQVGLVQSDDVYLEAVSITFDNVERDSWEKELDPELFINEIEVGYDKTEYEENSGLEEYNNKSTYATTITNNKKKLDLKPEYRGDGYGISFALADQISDTETTDTKYDNENFFVDTKQVPSSPFLGASILYVQKGRDDFDIVNNIDQITQPINLNFTPAKLLERNSRNIATSINKYQSTKVKFVRSDVKTDLETQKTGETLLVENGDIAYTQLKAPRFSGFLIKFVVDLTSDEFQTIKTGRYKRIKVLNPINNEYTYGWIMDVTHILDESKGVFEIREQLNGTEFTGNNIYTNEDLDFYDNEDDDFYTN